MGMFEQFNRVNTVREGIDLGSMEFRKLREFAGQSIHVDGFFFTRSKFGEQVVVVGNGYKINMPGRAVEEFKKMMGSKELLDAILSGHMMIQVSLTPKGNASYVYKDC